MSPEVEMNRSQELAAEKIAQLRRLAHDLSNSLETIIQASYLMAQAKLDAKSKKLLAMLDQAAQDAVRINRSLRELLRSQSESSEK